MGSSGRSSGRDLLWFLACMALLMAGVLSVPAVSATEHPVRVTAYAIGCLGEAAGLLMAVVGLSRLWRANAPGQAMYPPAVGLGRLLGRRPVSAAAPDPAEEHPARRDDRQHRAAGADGSSVAGPPAPRMAVDGLPIAVAGLALTLVGFVVQVLARGVPS